MHANSNEYDHSILSDIDPDIYHNNCGNSKYYFEILIASCKFQFFANKFVCAVLTDLLTRFC